MNVKEALYARRTIHKYIATPISHDLLREALQAALTAPNHKHTFPWHFVIVGPETREKLVDAACLMDEEKKGTPTTEESRARHREKLLTASALVVFCCKRSDDPFRGKEDYASVCCAIENFTLFLTAEGWGSKWSTGGITSHPLTYEALGVNSREFEINGFVWVGKPAVQPGEQKRPALTEVLIERP